MNRAIAICSGLFGWFSLALIAMTGLLGFLVWTFGKDLPGYSQLSRYEPPSISRIFDGEGRLIDEFAQERRLFSPIEEIPDLVVSAFISAEDKNFYLHSGYDLSGMGKAALDALSGGRLRGASTITQQVMKNFLLGGERSVERKIRELILAVRLEHNLTKDEILELYLNDIFLGQNSYGVTAAAQTYFNKSLEDLLPHETAYLASLPKAPSTYHPVRQKERATTRRNFVIREMVENGYLSVSDGNKAVREDLRTVLGGEIPSFRESMPPRGYFTDEIRRQLSSVFGKREFFGGGLKIRATLDPDLQAAAESALRKGLEDFDRSKGIWRGSGESLHEADLRTEARWRAALARSKLPSDIPGWRRAVVTGFEGPDAILGVEGVFASKRQLLPGTNVGWARSSASEGSSLQPAHSASDLLGIGDVVLVSRSESKSERVEADLWTLRQLPEVQGAFIALDTVTGRVLAMQGGFSYEHSKFNRATQALRQPGSVFKPLVYAAALDAGYTPASIVIDAPIRLQTSEGIWRPNNASNRFYGPVTLRTGIEQSRNLMTIRLAREIGMDTVAEYAESFGIYDELEPFLSNALGAQETTLYRIVTAFAIFANGGQRVVPTLVDRVQDRYGQTIYRHDDRVCQNCSVPRLAPGLAPQILSRPEQVLDPVTAYQSTLMMEGVVKRGTASTTVNVGFPVAGKTGTTNESRDAWFIGYTPRIAAGCYIGYDLPRSLGEETHGGSLCGPVFREFMEAAVAKFGSADFEKPAGGEFIDVDIATGTRVGNGVPVDRYKSRNPGVPGVIAEFFRFGTGPNLAQDLLVNSGFTATSGLQIERTGQTREAITRNALEGDIELGAYDGKNGDQPVRRSFGSLSSGGLY